MMETTKVISEISPKQLWALGFISSFTSDPQIRPASKLFKLKSLELTMPNETVNEFYHEGIELFQIITLRELTLLINII